MLFVTNRFPTQSIRTRVNRNFTFDLDNNAPSNSVFFCRRTAKEDYVEIGSRNFMEEIRKAEYRQVLAFVHGFSNLPEYVFAAAEELQGLCDGKRAKEALVIPFIWPCDNDLGIVKDYWDDQKAADASAYSFSRVLDKFNAWRNEETAKADGVPCLKRINVLAHSMGNRVLRGTLDAWRRYDLAAGVPLMFRNTFLVAADVVNETLERGNPGEAICHASRNVIVYFASDDLALRSSKAANLKNRIASRRLGHTGPEDMDKTPKNVFSVDCDDVNTAYDLPKGHTYFRSGRNKGDPGLVFEHIFETLLTGRVFPEDEHRRTTIIREAPERRAV